MGFGISNQSITTLQNITDIVNISNPGEFFITADQIMFGGWFWFIIIAILGIIVYRVAQEFEDQPLVNTFYTTAGLTVVAFLMRAYCMSLNGIQACMVNDWQMWMFPVLLVVSGSILYFIKE